MKKHGVLSILSEKQGVTRGAPVHDEKHEGGAKREGTLIRAVYLLSLLTLPHGISTI